MRKRSEIKRNRPTEAWCKACGLQLESRAIEGPEDTNVVARAWFCTVHGFVEEWSPTKPEIAKEETVADLSGKLNDEIDEAKREIARREIDRRPDQWDSANRAKEKPLEPSFARIMEKVIVEDPLGTYERLEEQLRIGEDRSDRGVLLRALDSAESNARLAHRLFISAKLERERYELNNKIIFGAMREAANRVLQREKHEGLRNKQITEEDLETMSAQLFPDEYEEQSIRRKKAELLVKSMENLADLWRQRCSALEVMLGKSR